MLGARDRWTELPVVGEALSRTRPEPLRYAIVRSALCAMERGNRAADAGAGPDRWPARWRAPILYREGLACGRND